MAAKGKRSTNKNKPTAKKSASAKIVSSASTLATTPPQVSNPVVPGPPKSKSAPMHTGMRDEKSSPVSEPFNLASFNTLLTELTFCKWGLAENKRAAITERMAAIGLDEESSSSTVINAYNALLEGAKLDAQSRLTVLKIVADGYAASMGETRAVDVPALSHEEVKAAVNALVEPSREEVIPTPARRGVKLSVQDDDEYERVG